MKKFLILSLIVGGAFAHAGEIPNPEDFVTNIDLVDPPKLGRGYKSKAKNFAAVCVTNNGGTENTNFQGSLNMRLDSSQDDAATSLGFQAGGRYRSGVTETSASAQLAQSAVSTGYSVNFTYKFESLYNEQFRLDGKNEMDVVGAFQKLIGNDRGFYQACGDEYVSSASRAARLLVNLNVSFSSAEEASKFAADFSFNSPTVGVTAAIQQAASRVSKKTTMKFWSVQIGGSPGFSGKAVCPDNIAGGSAAGNNCASPVIQCGFGKFDQCIAMLEGVVSYSADVFAKQVTKQNGEPQNYAVAAVHVQPYIYAGEKFPLPPDKVSEQVFQQELSNLNAEFERYFKAWVFANRVYMSKTPRLSRRQDPKVSALEVGLHKIVSHIASGIEECYKYGYDKCHKNSEGLASYISTQTQLFKTAVGEELDGIDSIDQINTAIERLTRPETFAQYCDLGTENYPELKVTVDSLRAWSVAKLAKDEPGRKLDKGDECANLESYLNDVEDLDLSNDGSSDTKRPIASLAPIATLKNVKSLKLRGQSLSDVSPLAKLKNLVELNLDRNAIRDICSLSELGNLSELSIQNNEVSSVDCLKVAPKLLLLDARGNSDQLTCPLTAVGARCKIKDFSKALNVSDRPENCGVHIGSEAISLGSGQIMVIGGITPAYGLQPLNAIDVYDRDGCWASGNLLNVPRTNFTLTKLRDGRILAVGGYTDTAEIIDPSGLNARLVKARMKSSRSFHSATLLPDGRVLIVGGYTDHIKYNLRSRNVAVNFEIFDPKTETFSQAVKTNLPRAEHSATLLADGTVLILGGYQDGKALSAGEIIDPKNGTTAPLPRRLHEGRFGHSAVALADGRVLVVGGMGWEISNNQGSTLASLRGLRSLELFDPKAGTFETLSDRLAIGRGLIKAHMMADGRVVLIGGNTEGHLFDPVAASPYAHGEEGKKDSSNDHDLALATASSLIEIFDPSNLGLFGAGSLNMSRSQMTVAPLDDRSLLVIGGMGSNESMISAELLVYRP